MQSLAFVVSHVLLFTVKSNHSVSEKKKLNPISSIDNGKEGQVEEKASLDLITFPLRDLSSY